MAGRQLDKRRSSLKADEANSVAERRALALPFTRGDPAATKQASPIDAKLESVRSELAVLADAREQLEGQIAVAVDHEEARAREAKAREAEQLADALIERGEVLAKALQKTVTAIRDIKENLEYARRRGLGAPSSESTDVSIRDLMRLHLRELGDLDAPMPNRR